MPYSVQSELRSGVGTFCTLLEGKITIGTLGGISVPLVAVTTQAPTGVTPTLVPKSVRLAVVISITSPTPPLPVLG